MNGSGACLGECEQPAEPTPALMQRFNNLGLNAKPFHDFDRMNILVEERERVRRDLACSTARTDPDRRVTTID